MDIKVENKKYYVKAVNSSKANKMTAYYHYSGVGFKKARHNLGVYRKEDKKLVGILQWGCSFQEGIDLSRYVKDDIKKEEYLELNRFCMADSEGKNSESQAISLGIKWIKKNLPDVRLLVSYAGRKEGNYGYIYQASNWEYLGYFVSEGFWFVDGEERHLNTLWSRYEKYGNKNVGFTEGLCEMYNNVEKTWTKQFIYIQRLDKALTPSIDPQPYPKPSNEYPIKIREKIYKKGEYKEYRVERECVEYYDEGLELLFTRRTLQKRGELTVLPKPNIATYNARGELVAIYDNIDNLPKEFNQGSVRRVLDTDNPYKKLFFRKGREFSPCIEIPILCIIEDVPYLSITEVATALGISKQAVSASHKRKSKKLKKIPVEWKS